MDQAQLNQEVKNGNVKFMAPSQAQPQPEEDDQVMNQFLSLLTTIRQLKQPLTAAPTSAPKSFPDQIQFEDDGTTKSLWLYINNVWQQFIPSTGTFVEVGTAATGQYASAEHDNGTVSGSATIDWNNGNVQYITLSAATTLTFSNPLSGGRYLLHVAGAYVPTFPSTVRWPSGTTPTATATSGHKDIYSFVYSSKESLYDGAQNANYATT
jgi:hypothetical protein